MKLLKHKSALLITITLLTVFFTQGLLTARAFAAQAVYQISCIDDTTDVVTVTNKQKHQATVKCKSGATLDITDQTKDVIELTASCSAKDQYPIYKLVNGVGDKATALLFSCVFRVSGGNTSPADGTPTVKAGITGSTASKASSGTGNNDTTLGNGDCKTSLQDCGIIKRIVDLTNIIAGLATLIIIGTLIFAGIQYSSAGADPAKVQAAKKRISNALLALVVFIFGYTFLQWVIPGGIF